MLLGGTPGEEKPPAPVDPRLPKGALRRTFSRPQHTIAPMCGLRRAVCVHLDARVPLATGQLYLRALEQAWDRFVGALGLPAPLPDFGLGPTAGLDLYLMNDALTELHVAADPRRTLEDRTSGFCQVRPFEPDHERHAAACLLEVSLLGLDAAETPHVRRAIATELRLLAAPPSRADYQSFDDQQANPQLGILTRDASGASNGSAIWFRYAGAQLAAPRSNTFTTALLQLARGATKPGEPEWHNEPDTLDVLRAAFAERARPFEDFLLDFAIARAFLGARDAAQTQPALAWLGNAGRVRFDWVLTTSSLPRRVAPRRPIEPFGASYLWLDLDRVTLSKTLAFRAEWEAPVAFRWSLVAVDGAGRQLKRFDLPYVQNATSAERTLVDYDGARGFIIVGTNLGGVDLAHPFDPDFEPHEPHGFTVYLAEI